MCVICHPSTRIMIMVIQNRWRDYTVKNCKWDWLGQSVQTVEAAHHMHTYKLPSQEDSKV